MRSNLLRAAAVVLVAFIACESPTEPSGQGERVPIDQVVGGSLNTTDSVHRFSFLARAGREYSVSFEATEGVISLLVLDSATGFTFANGLDGAGTPGIDQNASAGIRDTTDRVILIELRRGGAVATESYRFMVYQVVPTPESRAARFTIGDTVSGEMLDPVADVDEFVAAGQAGQEIAGIIYGLNATGVGLLGLSVTDTATGAQIGFARGHPYIPDFSTVSGRFTLPGTRDYRFTVRGLPFGGHYTGPYLFRFHTINRAPESIGATVAVNTEIAGESIGEFGDVDEFAFPSAANAEFNVFFQGSAPRQAYLEVVPPGGGVVAATSTIPSDSGLFENATGRFRVAQAGAVTIRVTQLFTFLLSDTGAYRFYVYPVNRQPEGVPNTFAAGDTVAGEAIERAGDVDEFAFTGSAGQEFNMFFQALNGGLLTQLRLQVVGPDSAVLRDVVSRGTDTSLMRQVTGRFALPTTGSYLVRVAGVTSSTDRDVGPYRFSLRAVNRAPEFLPDTLAFGDSATGETIAFPGDVDEWHVTVPDSSGTNLVVQLGGDARDGTLMVELLDSVGQPVGTALAYSPDGLVSLTGRLILAPGHYTVRADPTRSVDRALMTGSYRLWLYRFSLGPEGVPDTVAVGDTITEPLEPLGDVDIYHFFGTRRQHVNLALQGMESAGTGTFAAAVVPPGGAPFVSVGSPTSSGSLSEHQTNRVDLPVTGWYRLVVDHGSSPGPGLADHGLYRVALEPRGVAPEHVSDTLSPGDSVVGEPIDYLGDWDEYVVSAPAASELALLFKDGPRVLAFDPTTLDSINGIAGTPGVRAAGPFAVPAAGQVHIAVFEGPGAYAYTGGYALRVVAVNRAPESVSGTFVTGDTVRGEALAPLADIDEFTASGTPGQMLTPFIRLLANPTPVGRIITLEVVDPTTGTVLVGSNAGVTAASSTFFSPGGFSVPAGGTYRIRVRAGGLFPDEVATAPYEFFVRSGP